MTPQKSSPDDFDVEIETESTEAVTLAYQTGHVHRLVVSSGIVAMCFTVVLVWSLGAPPGRVVAPAVTIAPASEAPTPPTATPPPAAGAPAVQLLALERPRRLAPLMALALPELRVDGSQTTTRLEEVLRDGITVVNLWATYCEPCMRELAVFRAAARESAGHDARFVFVMSEAYDQTKPKHVSAIAELRGVAPRSRMLIDPAYDVDRALRGTGLFTGATTQLPMTLVMRCGEVAWGQVGEVELTELTAALASQQRLGRCERAVRPPVAPITTSTPSPPGPCGDGVCDRLAGETCASCTADCGCSAGSCVRNAEGSMHCARDLSTLKD